MGLEVRIQEADCPPVSSWRFVIILFLCILFCCSNNTTIEHCFLVLLQRSHTSNFYSSPVCLYNIHYQALKYQVRSIYVASSLHEVAGHCSCGNVLPGTIHGNYDTPHQSKFSTPAPGSW
jgi:hypothetical protein